MIYDIRHVTTYSYESPVSFARCSLRLEPKSGDGQQLVSHAVDIRPRPADRTMRTDFFGIRIETVSIETPHRTLRIDSRARVTLSRTAPGRHADSPAWEGVREAAFELLHEELPYSVAVEIDEFREGAASVYIRAVVYVERDSQKGIVIGAGGRTIKTLGQAARGKIEALLDERVFLELRVKVLPKWRRHAPSLKRLGYAG